MILAFAVLSGVLVGLLVGMLGGGGSVLTVPVLVYLLDVEPHDAVLTSLVIVGTAALVALPSYAKRGLVRWGHGATFGALGLVGAVVGSRLSTRVPADILLISFAALLLIVAVALVRRRRRQPGTPVVERTLSCPVWSRCWQLKVVRIVLAATAVGVITGFFGVGGGFIAVPALTIVLGLAFPEAVATGLLVIAINASAGFAARVGTPIELSGVLPFALAAVAAAAIGPRLAGRVSADRLRDGMAVLLVAVGVYVGTQATLSLTS